MTNAPCMKYKYLKLSAGSSNANSSLVTHNLSGDHCHSLALRGINFARHDTTARFIFRETQFAEATPRARTKEPNVIGDLHQGTRDDIQSTMSLNQGIVTG